MHVIATMVGLLSFRIDIASQMGLIGSFIFGKAYIAINAVCAVLCFYTADTFIKQRDTGDNYCKQVLKLATGEFIQFPMRIEPFTIVVCKS